VLATVVIREPHVDGLLGNRALTFQMPTPPFLRAPSTVLNAAPSRPSDTGSGDRTAWEVGWHISGTQE